MLLTIITYSWSLLGPAAGLGLCFFVSNMHRYKHIYPGIEIHKIRHANLSHYFIHIVPVSVSLMLLWINLKGYYIGIRLPFSPDDGQGNAVVLAPLQVAAKIQV